MAVEGGGRDGLGRDESGARVVERVGVGWKEEDEDRG